MAFALGAGASLWTSSRTVPTYQATAKIFIGPKSVGTDIGQTISELTFSRDLVASYAELLHGRQIAEKVVEKLRLSVSPLMLSRGIKTKILPDTRIIDLTITDTDSNRAALTANALVQAFVTDQQAKSGASGAPVSVSETALAPQHPVAPKPMRDGILGALLGLMIGAGLAFGFEQFDTRIRSKEDVELALAPVPVLAEIPSRGANTGERTLLMDSDPGSPAAEAFRMLRTNLQFLAVDKPVRRLLVTSAYAADGKSTVAVNLAASMAAGGFRTVLIDTDLRRPVIDDYFSKTTPHGVSDLLAGRGSLEASIQPVHIPNLAVLSSGPVPPNPAELLGSQRMADLVEEVSTMADVVIFDTPPALPVTDATVLGAYLDGVVIVVRAGVTHRHRAQEVVRRFELLGVRVLGVVLNGVEHDSASSYYNNYYYYRYRAGERPSRDAAPVTAANGRQDQKGNWIPTERSNDVVVMPASSEGLHKEPPESDAPLVASHIEAPAPPVEAPAEASHIEAPAPPVESPAPRHAVSEPREASLPPVGFSDADAAAEVQVDQAQAEQEPVVPDLLDLSDLALMGPPATPPNGSTFAAPLAESVPEDAMTEAFDASFWDQAQTSPAAERFEAAAFWADPTASVAPAAGSVAPVVGSAAPVTEGVEPREPRPDEEEFQWSRPAWTSRPSDEEA